MCFSANDGVLCKLGGPQTNERICENCSHRRQQPVRSRPDGRGACSQPASVPFTISARPTPVLRTDSRQRKNGLCSPYSPHLRFARPPCRTASCCLPEDSKLNAHQFFLTHEKRKL